MTPKPLCGEIADYELDRPEFPAHPCELPPHPWWDMHRANGVRWQPVIDYDEEDTLP